MIYCTARKQSNGWTVCGVAQFALNFAEDMTEIAEAPESLAGQRTGNYKTEATDLEKIQLFRCSQRE